MLCKFCQSELNEDEIVCPACGRSQEEPLEETVETVMEETPVEEAPAEAPAQPEMKPGMTPGKIALFVIGCVVLFAIVVGLVIGGMQRDAQDQSGEPVETAAPTEAVPEETVEYTVPADGNPADVTCKGSYTVTDEEAIAANATVVATNGDYQLTNGQLQAYYWDSVITFVQQYGSYLAYFGLDMNYPLDTQPCPLLGEENPGTWQQFFLLNALDGWHSNVALLQEAEAEGFKPDAETQQALDNMPKDLETAAANSGAASTEEFIHKFVGVSCTVENYVDMMYQYNEASVYEGYRYGLIQPTDAEVDAFYEENKATYEENGLVQEPTKTYNVRHILLEPENGVTDETGYYKTYSDADWAACLQKAEELLNQWKTGDATEEGFAALAKEHTVDGGSKENGGMYEDLTADTNFVEEFKTWYLDEARQVGDTGIVQSVYGYHIMFFSGTEEAELWRDTVRQDIINEKGSTLIPAAMEKYPVTVDYTAIVLGLVDLMG